MSVYLSAKIIGTRRLEKDKLKQALATLDNLAVPDDASMEVRSSGGSTLALGGWSVTASWTVEEPPPSDKTDRK